MILIRGSGWGQRQGRGQRTLREKPWSLAEIDPNSSPIVVNTIN